MDEIDWGGLLTYVTVLILACFGGVVDFLEKLHRTEVKPPMKTILFSLLVKLMSSAFAGLLMYWILEWRADNGVVVLSGLSAMSISISGYLGIQAVNIFINMFRSLYDKSGSNK